MRILFVAHQFFPEHYAGVEVLTLGMARALKARGHEVFVFAARRSAPVNDIQPGEVVDYEYEGLPVRRVGRPTEGPNRPYALDYDNPQMAARAREYVEEVRPDIVHIMNLQGVSASVIEVFKEANLPVVYTATDFWTVCPVVDLRRHDGAMCEGPNIADCVKCVGSRHPGSRADSVTRRTPSLAIKAAAKLAETPLRGAVRPLEQIGALADRIHYIREKMEMVDHVLAPATITRDLLVANGMEPRSIEVSGYGIDISGITKSVPAPGDTPLRVGFIGTLAPHKGCDTLIKAFRNLPEDVGNGATLTIYGNLQRFKPFIRKLRHLAGEDGRITFAGPFARENVGKVLDGLDVVVVPSRWYENQPTVILESFASGTPVIATDLGGMSEFVKHEENGLLFELDKVEQLSCHLQSLAKEPEMLEKLRSGIGHIKTVEEQASELEEIYTGIESGEPGGCVFRN